MKKRNIDDFFYQQCTEADSMLSQYGLLEEIEPVVRKLQKGKTPFPLFTVKAYCRFACI